MKIKNTFFSLLLLSILLPSTGHSYLNEQTTNKTKMRRATTYKQVSVKEDIDSDGVVRKVSWNGPQHPELETMLGPCYSYYRDYMKNNTRLRMRGPLSINKNGCHITMGGHMRNVSGEASIDK